MVHQDRGRPGVIIVPRLGPAGRLVPALTRALSVAAWSWNVRPYAGFLALAQSNARFDVDQLGRSLVRSFSLLTTAIAFYASSFSRDTLRAILATVGIWCGSLPDLASDLGIGRSVATVTGQMLAPLLGRFTTRRTFAHGVLDTLYPMRAKVWIGGTFAVGLCLVVAPLIGSFRHFKTIDVGSKEIRWSALTAFLPAFLSCFYS